MKIFIKYKDDKNIFYTKDYQSINSIINQYFIDNKIDDDTNEYNVYHNGILLNYNFSLEKYNINEDEILDIYPKLKGGNSFFTFFKKNFVYVIIVFIIVLLPSFILPLGLIPLTSTLIQLIIDKSIESIGKFLVCKLGKVTIFKRLKLLTYILKYVIFVLMIYVVITFPLILLCTTLKGQSILNDPKKMCSPLSAGSTAGAILTLIYFVIYLVYRSFNMVLNTIIKWCKYFEWTNYLLNPFFNFILILFNNVKYLTLLLLPNGSGAIALAYFRLLDAIMPGLNIFIKTATDIGCKAKFSKEGFEKSIMKGVEELIKQNKSKDSDDSKEKDEKSAMFSFGVPDSICDPNAVKCCSPENYLFIANAALGVIEDRTISPLLKTSGIFPAFCLFTETLFESAAERLSNDNDDDKENNTVRKELFSKVDKRYDEKMKKKSDEETDKKNSDTKSKIELIYKKIHFIDNDIMVKFSEENGSKYVSRDKPSSLFKKIFKIIFVDIFCNIVSTTKVSDEIITKMGEMKELVDILKSGTASGIFLSFFYSITIIVLIICGIFNIF
jgi:hypothetical protein